jgi:hypothetical protein
MVERIGSFTRDPFQDLFDLGWFPVTNDAYVAPIQSQPDSLECDAILSPQKSSQSSLDSQAPQSQPDSSECDAILSPQKSSQSSLDSQAPQNRFSFYKCLLNAIANQRDKIVPVGDGCVFVAEKTLHLYPSAPDNHDYLISRYDPISHIGVNRASFERIPQSRALRKQYFSFASSSRKARYVFFCHLLWESDLSAPILNRASVNGDPSKFSDLPSTATKEPRGSFSLLSNTVADAIEKALLSLAVKCGSFLELNQIQSALENYSISSHIDTKTHTEVLEPAPKRQKREESSVFGMPYFSWGSSPSLHLHAECSGMNLSDSSMDMKVTLLEQTAIVGVDLVLPVSLFVNRKQNHTWILFVDLSPVLLKADIRGKRLIFTLLSDHLAWKHEIQSVVT